MLTPIIMAGGSGSRLWPLSRSHYPKQFIDLVSKQTMLQQTIKRLDGIETDTPLVICNEQHRFLVAEQLRSQNIEHGGIILEPVGRNTAPAIALAAFSVIKNKSDSLFLVLAADHVFQDIPAFQQAIMNGLHIAQSGKLVTFGIVPTEAHTGYGYIKKGNITLTSDAALVEKFVEKPDIDTARAYFDSKDYLWNSGMFMFTASRYLQELKTFAPDIYIQCELAIDGAQEDLEFIRIETKAFSQCRDESIDYAVMEHTKDAVVVPMRAGWNDVGSWASLWEVSEKDANNNVINGDVITVNTTNSLVRSDERLIATIGVNDLIIVDTKDAVMITKKNQVQDVKKVVNELKKIGRYEYKEHREVYRPWGQHDHIAEGTHYHVKKVIVRPQKQIAKQIHYHRSEHWIIVSGTAKVHKGNKCFIVTENESIYIPAGVAHCLENPGKIPLELIEVRSGSYLADDDIIRIKEENSSSL